MSNKTVGIYCILLRLSLILLRVSKQGLTKKKSYKSLVNVQVNDFVGMLGWDIWEGNTERLREPPMNKLVFNRIVWMLGCVLEAAKCDAGGRELTFDSL